MTAWSWPRTSEVEETVVRPLHLKIVEACSSTENHQNASRSSKRRQAKQGRVAFML